MKKIFCHLLKLYKLLNSTISQINSSSPLILLDTLIKGIKIAITLDLLEGLKGKENILNKSLIKEASKRIYTFPKRYKLLGLANFN